MVHTRYRTRPTGRFRPRLTFFGKVVMQVEEAKEANNLVPGCPPPPQCLQPQAWEREQAEKYEKAWKSVGKVWRDAKAEDMEDFQPILKIAGPELRHEFIVDSRVDRAEIQAMVSKTISTWEGNQRRRGK